MIEGLPEGILWKVRTLQSVEYPQGVISIQRTKASGLARATCSLFITTPFCVVLSLSLFGTLDACA